MHDFRDRFETLDGSSPQTRGLHKDLGKAHPLSCLSLLRHGDAFQKKTTTPVNDGKGALQYLQTHILLKRPFSLRGRAAIAAHKARVKNDISAQLCQNPALLVRMKAAKSIIIDLIPTGASFGDFGYPANTNPNVSGLFWDHPTWEQARIALREDALQTDTTLVFHEMAHAIHYLAFTDEERTIIYNHLRRTFGSRQAMDEAFAIYSERVFSPNFSEQEKRAPGIYGFARRQWEENHVFARFIDLLYAPHKNADLKVSSPKKWQKFSSS